MVLARTEEWAKVQFVPVNRLAPNPTQPRREWDVEKDEEGKTKIQRLAQSIKEQGLLSPLIVMRQNGKFIIICGERRFRAIKDHTTMKEIPCIVRENLTESEIVETSVTENLQREDLTPMDEAKAFQLLMEKCGYSQKKLGAKFGLSVAAVNYKLSLLKLTPELQAEVKNGHLSETDGRAISQAVNRVPSTKEEKVTAMKEIKDKVDQARETNGGKLKTKEVATIAKTVVDKVAKPNGNGKHKDDKPEKIQPPTKTEIAGAKEFAKALANAKKHLHPFMENGNGNVEKRLRFAFVLMESEKDAATDVAMLQQFFARLSEEIAEVKRQRMVAKLK
jgi:ParB/RepB/Spo0J family partition protein